MPFTPYTPAPSPSVESKGAANGIASLDAGAKVPATQLPSYVDDVLEYASISAFPAEGETGKIYVALDTNKSYRWSGSTYVELSSYAEATQSAAGLMSSTDKAKLDGIQSGATAVTVSNSLSDTSTTNALSAAQGKALKDAADVMDGNMSQSVLADGTDLNSLTIPYNKMPVWYCGNDISKMQNIPSELTGKAWPFSIECFYAGNGSSGYARQILHVYAATDSPSNIFVRNQSYVSGRNWLGWEKLALESEITPQGSSNLNDATAAGKYHYGAATSNSPDTNYSGSVDVIPASNGLIYQFAINTTNNAFIRVYKNSAWTSWEKLALNSKFTYQSTTSASTHTYQNRDVRFAKSCGCISIFIDGLVSLTGNASTEICTMPSGYGPILKIIDDRWINGIKVRFNFDSNVVSAYVYSSSGISDANINVSFAYAGSAT